MTDRTTDTGAPRRCLPAAAGPGPMPSTIPEQLRRRRAASLRCEPLHCGHRDPLDCHAAPPAPSTYSLSAAELRKEIKRCSDAGWQLWELHARFARPSTLRKRAS